MQHACACVIQPLRRGESTTTACFASSGWQCCVRKTAKGKLRVGKIVLPKKVPHPMEVVAITRDECFGSSKGVLEVRVHSFHDSLPFRMSLTSWAWLIKRKLNLCQTIHRKPSWSHLMDRCIGKPRPHVYIWWSIWSWQKKLRIVAVFPEPTGPVTTP